MAIVPGDLIFRLSVVTGSAGDSTAGTAAGSLGKYVSTTAYTTATVANVFDNVSGAEATAGTTEYRCIFLLNNHATLTYVAPQLSLSSQTAGGGDITFALDNIAVSAKGSASAQAAQIANETTGPTGVGTFDTSAKTIGDMAPGQVKGIWIKRIVSPGAAATNPDGVIFSVTGDTLP